MKYWPHSLPEQNDDEQRPCARGDRCHNAAQTPGPDGTHIFTGALGYRPFCDSDRDFVFDCVEALPRYFNELGDRIGDKGTDHGPKVSGSRTSPSLMNLTFDALRVEMVDVIASWAGRVYQVANITPITTERSLADRARYGAPLTADPEDPFQRMCETLAAHLDTLVGFPPETMRRAIPLGDADDLPPGTPVTRYYDAGYAVADFDLSGADAGLEMIRLEGRCRWLLGYTGKAERIGGRCFECEQVDVLIRPDSSTGLVDYAECSDCGARYQDAEYRMLLRAAYEEEISRQRLDKEAS